MANSLWDSASSILPQFSAASTMKWVFVIIIIILVAVGTFLFVWWLLNKWKFNKTAVIFEKINGVPQPVKKLPARLIPLKKAGDKVFYIKGYVDPYQSEPSIQTGANTYWFYVREDGELINFGPGDFDFDSREMGAKFLEKEMRYARTSLMKSIDERFNKKSWLAENWPMLVAIGVIVVLLVFMYLITGKLVEGLKVGSETAKTNKEVTDLQVKILGIVDQINNGGSGIKPAGT